MKIRALSVKVGETPKEIWIENTLEEMQEYVGGLIQPFYPLEFDDSAVIICNEEGKFNGMRPNRALEHDGEAYEIIFGDFLIVDAPEDSEDFESLTPEQVRKYQIMYF